MALRRVLGIVTVSGTISQDMRAAGAMFSFGMHVATVQLQRGDRSRWRNSGCVLIYEAVGLSKSLYGQLSVHYLQRTPKYKSPVYLSDLIQ